MLGTTLVDAYAKAGRLGDAEKVFEEMGVKDIATWNALICGFAVGSRAGDAVRLFTRLRKSKDVRGGKPDDVTVIGALSACAQIGAVAEGEAVREYAVKNGLMRSSRVCNALIDMYSKCGYVDNAVEVFQSMPEKTLVSWNTVIMGLAMHGHGIDAVHVFDEMLATAVIRPDAVTYLAVLCGCTHAGLVEEGLHIFNTMSIPPNVKHYGAVVDLLGRSGRLSEAHAMITSMPLKTDVVLWQTLLGACKTHGNLSLAESVSTTLSKLGSNLCGDYVLLSNVYAMKQRWLDVGRVRDTMREKDVRKIPGFSLTDVDGTTHRFVNGGRDHERWVEISRSLDLISSKIRELGYVADTSSVLHDIEEQDKELAVFYHSEKLAIAFGLISITDRSLPIRVNKNLRICPDCHVLAKLVSHAFDRVIVVRDRSRFHRFERGLCSCGDYW